MISREIKIIDPSTHIISDSDRLMKIYLLVAPGNDPTKTLGFKQLNTEEIFTCGFTSTERAVNFVRY